MTTSDLRRFRFDGEDVLRLPARTGEFVTLRNRLDRILDELAAPPGIRCRILVAADEVFTNIARYAYPQSGPQSGEPGSIEIEVLFEPTPRRLSVIFSDTGVPFNPLSAPAPDLDVEPENRPVGGLGIFLVRRLMDSVDYERKEDRNVLIFRKTLDDDGGEA